MHILNQCSEAANSLILRSKIVATMTMNAVCIIYGQEKTLGYGDGIYRVFHDLWTLLQEVIS
jgi:hypothetical protein